MNYRGDPVNSLAMWTIYARPTDHPHDFVVRRFLVLAGGAVVYDAEVRTAATLQAARKLIPRGLICLSRNPSDPPHVLETWL